jgi:hypothetical protein
LAGLDTESIPSIGSRPTQKYQGKGRARDRGEETDSLDRIDDRILRDSK